MPPVDSGKNVVDFVRKLRQRWLTGTAQDRSLEHLDENTRQDGRARQADHSKPAAGTHHASVLELAASLAPELSPTRQIIAAYLPLVGARLGGYDKFRSTTGKILRSFRGSDRAATYRHLMTVKERLGWGDRMGLALSHQTTFVRPSQKLNGAENACEALIMRLLEVGFPVDRDLSENILKDIAEGQTVYFLNGKAGDSSVSLGILRDIERLVAKHGPLSPEAQEHANQINDVLRHEPSSSNPNIPSSSRYIQSPRRVPSKTEQRLLKIAGKAANRSFFEQQSGNVQCRIVGSNFAAEEASEFEFLRSVFREAYLQLATIVRHYEMKNPPLSWLNSEAAFHHYFKPPGGDPVHLNFLSYGWWHKHEAPGLPSRNQNFRRTRKLAGQPLTDAHFERVCEFEFGMANRARYVFHHDGVPDVDAFTFDGLDRNGRLLDHLVNCGTSRPNKSWLKNTKALIDEIGEAAVREGFGRWLGHLRCRSTDDIDFCLAKTAYLLDSCHRDIQQTVRELIQNRDPKPWPDQVRGDIHIVRMCALKLLARAPIVLNSDVCSEVDHDYAASVIKYADSTSGISENNTRALRGVLFALSLVDARFAVEQLNGVARLMLAPRPGVRYGVVSPKCANAAIWSLGQIGARDAACALIDLHHDVDDRSFKNQIDLALGNAEKKLGPEVLKELRKPL